jgi:hypothetical protein
MADQPAILVHKIPVLFIKLSEEVKLHTVTTTTSTTTSTTTMDGAKDGTSTDEVPSLLKAEIKPAPILVEVTTTRLLLVCLTNRVDRYLSILRNRHGYSIQATDEGPARVGKTEVVPGFVWATLPTLDFASEVTKLRCGSSFDRFCTSLFPTRHVLLPAAETESSACTAQRLTGAILQHALLVQKGRDGAQPVKLRLHVHDETKALFAAVSKAIEQSPDAVLSPVDFTACVVVVCCKGRTEWDVITPSEFATIKQDSNDAKKVCRASHKLSDGLEYLGARGVAISAKLPALDVGASPGPPLAFITLGLIS